MDPIFTPAELEQVQAYVRPFYVWIAIRDVVNVAVFALIVRFAVVPLYLWAEALAARSDARLSWVRTIPVLRAIPSAMTKLWRGPGWGAALLFALFYVLLLTAIELPRDIYFGYFHEHRFGLSNYTPGRFAVDQLKAFAMYAVAMSLLAFGLYGLARRVKHWWLVLGIPAAVLMLFSSVIDPYRDQVFFEQKALEAGPLRSDIDKLMARANIEFRDVLVQKTSRASKTVNAYFAGQGPTRTIVLNDTLVDTLAPREVVAAVAHEAGHVNELRWPRRVMASVALVAFLFLLHTLLKVAHRRRWFGATEFADIRTLPLLGFALYVLLSLGQPLSAASSRARELAADRYALELTGDPEAFRAMLIRVTRTNKADPDPPRWAVLRAFSHPPMRERLDHVTAFEKASGK